MVKAKLYILDYGRIEADQAWFAHGAGVSTLSQKRPVPQRIECAAIGALIEHPEGNILFDTGAHPEAMKVWPEPAREAFPVTKYGPENRVDNILSSIGMTEKDITCVILSHLHLDHTGGLYLFKEARTPIYAHEEEIKWGFYCAVTFDGIAYVPLDLDMGLNWKAIHGEEIEMFEDVYLYHLPGHTPGLCSMRVKLENSGNWVFTADLTHLRSNFENEQILGWLLEDRIAWLRSLRKLKSIVKRTNAQVVFGHDAERLEELERAPQYYD